MQKSSEEIFNLVNQGILIYENLFKTPFPFKKYDQIFCPEFAYLGMENPGAVLLTDNYIFWEK